MIQCQCKYVFTVPGQITGKGRHRFSSRGGYVKAYTPQKTVEYEKLIASCFRKKYKGIENDKALKVMIYAYIKPAKSLPKRKILSFLKNIFFPTKKPDIDNIIKVVLDALNNVAYKDDTQVVSLVAVKRFGEEEKLIIGIEEIGLSMQSA